MSAFALTLLPAALAALVVPQRLPLHRAAPVTAAAVLMLALLVRALVMVALSVLALLRLSEVGLVDAALSWCWHELLPDLPGALGFAEHPVAHAVVGAPLVLLTGSVGWLAANQLWAWRGLRRSLAGAVAAGPQGSMVVRDERVLLAVTRLGPARVLVSERALGELDGEELAAGLAHERAHLRRGHRLALALAALLGASARLIPGTRTTERAFAFQLERDADACVVQELRDPLALASAICKTGCAQAAGPALVTLGGTSGSAVLRVRELLEGHAVRSPKVERSARALLVLLTLVALGVASSAPAWADSAHAATASDGHACSHH